MTTTPPPSPAAVARREASQRALRRFAARRGRLMGWYLAALATVVVLITVAVMLIWTTGEAANAHLKVAAKAATILPRTALSSTPQYSVDLARTPPPSASRSSAAR